MGSLNKAIATGHFSEIVQVAEAAQEKEIAAIATEIAEAYERGVRIVLVAGPSSSGKTTFTKRLRLQLMANYLRPHQLSLDNYFVAREFTPLDDKGEYDYEHIEALDLELFASDLRRLLRSSYSSVRATCSSSRASMRSTQDLSPRTYSL